MSIERVVESTVETQEFLNSIENPSLEVRVAINASAKLAGALRQIPGISVDKVEDVVIETIEVVDPVVIHEVNQDDIVVQESGTDSPSNNNND